ncbi:TlpA family protein disulfide reductase [Niabella sp. CC-SYL272]|uniref:peroxiredoxin family protein n=1 Tax=Niabella agricola TaxID=2891571 RepID=UPI001F3CEBC1|nr:TlpA disulfide reductase family protein [Niabella agricola]MCF3111956.1 TlpA family protein disulfide reductase [Niabella agricola]
MAKRVVCIGLLLLLVMVAMAQTMVAPTPAIHFTLNSRQGTPVSLNDYRGKTVLVVFWASWCVPCRVENRKLVQRYPRLKALPFEIISISVDTDREKWERAIAADKMGWPQLIDTMDEEKRVARRWNASALPASFLVDPQGTIRAVDAAALPLADPRGFRSLLKKLAGME